MRVDRLGFHGPQRTQVTVPFTDGLNVIWGASNHGKSFAAQAMDFILGSKGQLGKGALTIPKEGRGFDRCSLWVSIGNESFTVQRAAAGGSIEMAEGHHELIDSQSKGYQKLLAQHSEKTPSLSTFILEKLGYQNALLLKNERADKVTFTFRMLMRYLFIDETRIFGTDSVIVQRNDQPTAEDKSLLKFLISGIDGSAVAPVPTSAEQKAARSAKIDVLQELRDERASELDASKDDDELEEAIAAAKAIRDNLNEALKAHQDSIDASRMTLNSSRSELRKTEAKIADLQAMDFRFVELRRILASDIQRLAGLEEGGFLVRKFSTMNCPLCGADHEHQNHDHHLETLEEQQSAARAEIEKIRTELHELDAALAGVAADILENDQNSGRIRERIQTERDDLLSLQQDNSGSRTRFVDANEALRVLTAEQERRAEIALFEKKIGTLEDQKISGRPKAEGFDPSISTGEAHDLSLVVRRVLLAWGFPGIDTVSFDLAVQDLIIDGKERRTNGKGVRAVLHSAFQVAVLIFCREQGRPHPGFLILDTPLLAYREPKAGDELREDEGALVQSGVATKFYAHLASLSSMGQFIIIENATPPSELPSSINQIHYDGGQGLFSH